MPIRNTAYTYTMVAAGGAITVDVEDLYTEYNLVPTGGGFLQTGNFSVSVTGTPTDGMEFTVNYGGLVTYDGGSTTLFGRLLTASEMLAKYIVKAKYINSAWIVHLCISDLSYYSGASLLDGTITNAKITTGTIALNKLVVGAARGYFLRAGAAGVWEAANGVTSGNILQGNGTDIVSNTVTGDITISGTGVTTIGAGKVTAAMLAYTPSEYFQAELTITSAQILALNGTPLTIVAAPGVGYHIEVISATSSMTFVTAAYATNTTLQLINTGATIAQLQDTAILLSTVNKITKFKDVTSAAAGETQIITNTALQVKVLTGNPTLGDSTVKVIVTYKVVAD